MPSRHSLARSSSTRQLELNMGKALKHSGWMDHSRSMWII
uniref:Uncharacterized protein n=1 Tax=Arundo donax TaxID=35708 RepID=A0A0A9F5Q0_ARUDO